MEWNKADMAGGAAVLAAAWAVADLELPLRLRVLVPCAENLGGPDAYRPGDVIRHRDGRTSEVRFTDGEGRLILADVLAYASALEAAAVVDVATLTSPYGPRMWGYASNDESLASELAAASAEAGEPAFRVPLHHAYLDELESPIADLANYVTVPGAANDHSALKAITAALFLESFVDDRAWAHIDIAGTAFNLLPGAGLPAGATGCTVATLVRLAMRYAGAKSPR
jgi:leucyl aminopeptidase